MSTTKDFENAPVGATATHDNGSRAMKMDDSELGWIIRTGHYWSDEVMARWGYTLDPTPAPATAREALDLAWELAHEVKGGQVIPKGTRYLTSSDSGLREYTAQHDVKIRSSHATVIRTVEPLPEPEPEPDWLDAPAVIATPGWGPDRGVWVPKSGGHWKCACCRDERHWSELRDVTPLYPKETDR